MVLGRDWDLSPQETAEATTAITIGFAECLPHIAPRDEVSPILAAALKRNPLWQSFSANQRAYVWERCYKILDGVYRLTDR